MDASTSMAVPSTQNENGSLLCAVLGRTTEEVKDYTAQFEDKCKIVEPLDTALDAPESKSVLDIHAVTTGSISKCASFWRIFVESKWVMVKIDNGYDLVWVTTPPIAREMPISKSALENHEFVTKASSDMAEESAASALPTGVIPTVVNSLSVAPKPHSERLRLVVNMRYANNHLVKRVLKFEGLYDIANMANK
jgi:hypothetical protein